MTYQDVLDALDSILEKLRGNNSELCEKLGIEIDDPYINGEDDDSEEVDSEDVASDEGDFADVNAEIDNADDEQLADDEDETSVNEAEAKKDEPKSSMFKKAADKASSAWNKTTKWVKDNPGKAVAAAAGTGLATALIGDMLIGDDEEEDESTQQSFNESNDDDSFIDHAKQAAKDVGDAASATGKVVTDTIKLGAKGAKFVADKARDGIKHADNFISEKKPEVKAGETVDVTTPEEIEQIEVGGEYLKKEEPKVGGEKPKDNDGQPEVKVEQPKDGDKKLKDGDKKTEDDEIVIDDEEGETVSSPSDNDTFGIQKAADTVKSGAITGGALIGAGLLGSALLNRRRRRRRS